jgi:hypothetical protein
MPLIIGKDPNGVFYKWGESGHKYYYISGNKESRNIAKNLALRQGRAIHVSKSKRFASLF